MGRRRAVLVMRAVAVGLGVVLLALAATKLVQHLTRPVGIRGSAAQLEPALCVAFSPDGGRVAVGTRSGAVRLVRVGDLKVVQTFGEGGAPVHAVAFSPDGALLAAGSADGTVRLWSLADGSAPVALRGHEGPVTSVAFSPDGALLASGSGDSTVRIWNVRGGTAVRVLRSHREGVKAVAFSPDGTYLASSGGDQEVKLWPVGAGGEAVGPSAGETKSNPGASYTYTARALAFSPDGKALAAGGLHLSVRDEWCGTPPQVLKLMVVEGQLRVWSVPDGTVLWTLGWEGEGGVIDEVTSIAFSPDGRFLAAGSADWAITIWDLRLGKAAYRWEAHGGGVSAVAWSPDGGTLVSVADDGLLQRWEVRRVLRR